MRTRANILTMPLADVQRITAAFNTLKLNGTYNGFVERHMRAMMDLTPPDETGTQRNVAHRGPSFGPWHRAALMEIGDALRGVDSLIDDIPYWDWTVDAALPGGPQTSQLWTDAYIGPDGDPNQNNRVLSGPFANWQAWTYVAKTDSFRARRTTGLVRQLGRTSITTLPTGAQVTDVLNNYQVYDVSPWDETQSTRSFRNRLEGWYGGNVLHNRVHRWIAGDMQAGTSPNDPVFWFHHANVDRLWWNWQQKFGITSYAPTSGGPTGHNLNDTMTHLLGTWTPASVLDIGPLGYAYA